MARTVAETIKALIRVHLEENNGLLFGQAISAVGWVNDTVPDCRGIVEFPMSDVSNMGVACGAAITGRRPIIVIRFQDFMWLNSSTLVNYAAKSKEIFGTATPLRARSGPGTCGLYALRCLAQPVYAHAGFSHLFPHDASRVRDDLGGLHDPRRSHVRQRAP